MADQPAKKMASVQDAKQQPRVKWDDSNMKSAYANVCNAVGTREEVVLFFGISNPPQSEDADVAVELSHRVILSPHAARRLVTMLTNVVEQYESRWGSLADAKPAAVKN